MVLIKNNLQKLEDTLAEQMLSREGQRQRRNRNTVKKMASYLYLITNNTQKQE